MPELELPGGLEVFRRPRWSFETFEHPLVCRFREALAAGGVRGLLRRAEQQRTDTAKPFKDRYQPMFMSLPGWPYPARDVDFSFAGVPLR
jgi:hypothetical protein